MKELKATVILKEKLKELWDTRPFWLGNGEAHHEKIFGTQESLEELEQLQTKYQAKDKQIADLIEQNTRLTIEVAKLKKALKIYEEHA